MIDSLSRPGDEPDGSLLCFPYAASLIYAVLLAPPDSLRSCIGAANGFESRDGLLYACDFEGFEYSALVRAYPVVRGVLSTLPGIWALPAKFAVCLVVGLLTSLFST